MTELTDVLLPDDLDSERIVLGAAMTDAEAFPQITGLLAVDDFSLQKHKLIFECVGRLFEQGEPISTTDIAYALRGAGQLEAVDGVSYLVQLGDVPRIVNLDAYCSRVREMSVRRRLIRSAQLIITRCASRAYEPGDSLAELERMSEALGSSRKRLTARVWSEIVEDEGGLNRFLNPQMKPGIHVPFPSMHDTLDGLRRGKLVLLGARPGVGKTALAAQICEHAAANGNNVLFVTLEMTARSVLHRSLTARARVSAYKFRRGTLTETERFQVQQQASELADLGESLTILDNADTTVQGIEALLRTLRARGRPIDLCVIDYLQLLRSIGRFENRVQEVSAISRGLKRLTQTFDIPVLALSQLGRKDDKYGEPQLDWLKESGQLEQDADQVLFLWLKTEPGEAENRREVSWKVAKNRDGILNRGVLDFNARFCRFAETVDEVAA